MTSINLISKVIKVIDRGKLYKSYSQILPTPNSIMLSQLERLNRDIDGRYASDAELQFIVDYTQSFHLRLQTYLRLQELESTLVQQTYLKMRSIDPSLFHHSKADVSSKWKQDTIRVLRYVSVALLLDDPETLRERFLTWFQTIMRAFGTQKSCDVTYQVLQNVVRQNLTSAQAELVCPILELTRVSLSTVSST